MWIRKFDVAHFRNVEQAHLTLSPHLNLIVGHNGSGKSSLLEAIHCLSTGQSFRTNKTLPIIAAGSSHTTVYGEVVSGEVIQRIGIKKMPTEGTQLRVNGVTISSQAELAAITPITGSSPEAEDLLEGSSKARLSYLDWCLFHVEPTFPHLWREYRRVLKQRNAALRNHMHETMVEVWNGPLAREGEQIHTARVALIQRIVPTISELIKNLLPSLNLGISYRPGWPKDLSLISALKQSLDTDRKMGFTHNGIHRADLIIKADSRPLTERLSRGQRKLVSIALRLAQAQEYMNSCGSYPVIFFDDLPAELDATSRAKVLDVILKMGAQTLITATAENELDIPSGCECSVFHVEQGKVCNVV